MITPTQGNVVRFTLCGAKGEAFILHEDTHHVEGEDWTFYRVAVIKYDQGAAPGVPLSTHLSNPDWRFRLNANEIDEVIAETLEEYLVRERLEYLRGEIEAERISSGEIAELQSLAEHIDEGDVQLLEWAGVPERPQS